MIVLFLFQANGAFDDGNRDFFEQQNGDDVIFDCFKAVLKQNVANEQLMPAEFRQWAETATSPGFEWPHTRAMGNTLKFLREQYRDNVKTNIRTHCKNRLKLFFRLRAYEWNHSMTFLDDDDVDGRYFFSERDVTNAINYTYNRRDTTQDEDERERLGILLDALRECDAPQDCNIINYVNDEHWFRSLWMWLTIQRYVQIFQRSFANVKNSWNLFKRFPKYVQKPEAPKPPKSKNFVVIPMCTFQRKHIRIDTSQLYQLVCETKIVPKKIGKGKKQEDINITQNEFLRNNSGSWDLFFNRAKIERMVHGRKVFDNQIVSDGVSATVLYLKPTIPKVPISDEEVLEMYNGGIFYHILGIDPGERTYNATVRKNISTEEEVNGLINYFGQSYLF